MPHAHAKDLPALPLEAWEESKITLHLYSQIVGKIRMALHPKLNHWWHVPLYVSSRGLTTGAVPTGGAHVEIAFDLIDHNLTLRSSDGRTKMVALYDGLSVAQFYRAVLASLSQFGIDVDLIARPFDPARVGSDIPFDEDDTHAHYDPEWVHRFWRVLVWADGVFTRYAGGYTGKSTPVHLFWHSFDLAYTRFSGRRVPQREGADPVTKEAYSHEVISFGFWPGDAEVRAPAFYAYAAPEPEGLAEASLDPGSAFWQGSNGSALALVNYDDLRRADDPDAALLGFMESFYQAAATRAGWDVEDLRNEFAYPRSVAQG